MLAASSGESKTLLDPKSKPNCEPFLAGKSISLVPKLFSSEGFEDDLALAET